MENYLLAILVIVTFLLIVQAGVFVGFFLLAKRIVELVERVGQLQSRAEYLLQNAEPVLKRKVGNWLGQRDEVLAFVQARPEDGGGGAVMVLLKAKGTKRGEGRGTRGEG